jgi:hypothetical protein
MQKGSKSKNMNLADVAKLHGMTATELMPQLRKGIKHEYEHTTSRVVARRTALDHLVEFPDYYDRLEKIEKMHLGGDMSMHLAPNGKSSNLTHEQWHLVRTPEFKAWFGDWENDPENSSKVVDSNGEPLVVYHTTDNEFFVFDKKKSKEGFFFSPNKERILVYGKKITKSYFLNIRNPSHELFKTDLKYLIGKGYDGIMDYGFSEKINESLYEIIVFYSNQIKLADGTNTTFDGNNPDIRFKKGGRTIAETPAPKKDRIYGSKLNKEGSASSGVKRITFNAELTKAIKNKVDEYNDRYPDSKVTLNVGKAVVRRGMGAYSKSHRPTISGGAPNSRQAWGLARLNKFLMKKSGQKVKKSYIQDDDLL